MAFECIECGYSASKWLGKCPQCNEWDTFAETVVQKNKHKESHKILNTNTEKLSGVKLERTERIQSGLEGFDRLSGGGIIEGEVVLLGGPPGVGKSTMFLQLAAGLEKTGHKILFISGEENPGQIKVHADRLGINGDNITVIGSGDLSNIEQIVNDIKPAVVFVDSIQAVIDSQESGAPGSLKQVKRCGHRLTTLAKNTGIVVFMSGQITKQGDIAGPKVLEHMVDAVFYMDYIEGNIRVVNAAKNRFGSCGDFVLYALEKEGLSEVDDNEGGSVGEAKKSIGQVTSCIRIGSRLKLVEIQVLAVNSYFEYPLRRTSGFSRERLLMLTAIAQKHLELKLGSQDIYLNVSGKNKVSERICDLSVIGAIYSSLRNMPVSNKIMFLGEVGLNGEVRTHQDISERIKFAMRNNFDKVCFSGHGSELKESKLGIVPIKNLNELNRVLNG